LCAFSAEDYSKYVENFKIQIHSAIDHRSTVQCRLTMTMNRTVVAMASY
jgi:hypothetical protein